ncbi:MAG TPA: YggT family protein [Alphaproteobacteria bacterium]|nr:YggT family protein [Alphaproteobacteria bacterium]HOO51300.1 YggT family protein [Alphaproteobacteria bacterium]
MYLLGQLLLWAITIYTWIIILQVAISWLVVFKVLDIRNPKARNLIDLLRKCTDPVMKPVQKYIPAIGGIDISPIVVIIALQILASIIARIFFHGYYGYY